MTNLYLVFAKATSLDQFGKRGIRIDDTGMLPENLDIVSKGQNNWSDFWGLKVRIQLPSYEIMNNPAHTKTCLPDAPARYRAIRPGGIETADAGHEYGEKNRT